MTKSDKYQGVCYNTLADGDKSYYVRFVVDGKRYDEKIGKHSEGIREAYCFKRRGELIQEARNGERIDAKIGLDDLAAMYFDTKITNASYEEMKKQYDYKIKPFFRDKPVTRITEDDALKFQKHLIDTKVGKREKPMAYATVNKYMVYLGSILLYGVSKGYLRENAARNIKSLPEDNARERYLDMDEVKELVECVEHDNDLLLFVEMSMSTGGRMGALMKLKKKDINLSAKTVTIADEKGKEHYTGFLNSRVQELLQGRLSGLGVNDSLYSSNQRKMQRQMKKILDKLFNVGLDKDDAKNRVVIHTLRHTFASHLAINGVPIFTIQKLMNHKDIKQTMRYAKLSPDSGREGVEAIWS